MSNDISRIAALNDSFRSSFVGGAVVLTKGVMSMSEYVRKKLVQKVQEFDDFNKDNNPYGEHDFGAVDVDGLKFFFKIDYYALDLKHGSEDPSDPKKTRRVMTLMRSEEY